MKLLKRGLLKTNSKNTISNGFIPRDQHFVLVALISLVFIPMAGDRTGHEITSPYGRCSRPIDWIFSRVHLEAAGFMDVDHARSIRVSLPMPRYITWRTRAPISAARSWNQPTKVFQVGINYRGAIDHGVQIAAAKCLYFSVVGVDGPFAALRKDRRPSKSS